MTHTEEMLKNYKKINDDKKDGLTRTTKRI